MKPWGTNGGPDEETLRRLVAEGRSDREIGEMHGITAEAIRYKRKRLDPPLEKQGRPERIDHRGEGAIPWSMNTALRHHKDPIAVKLRMRNRHAHGLPVSDEMLRAIARLERDLEQMGAVIDYDYNTGFTTRPRNPKIDDPNSIVRMPTNQG